MMSNVKRFFACTGLLAGIASGSVYAAEPWSFSANLGLVSNYLWRGVSQTDNQPAVQGGIDITHASGFHAGTWVSNVDFGPDGANYEWDLYLGYDFKLPNEDLKLGVTALYYAYPDNPDEIDFAELGLSTGYRWLSLGISYTIWGGKANEDALFDRGDLYYSLGIDVPLPQSFSIGLFGGYYDFKNDKIFVDFDAAGNAITKSADYGHWGIKISKDAGDFGTFSLHYEQNDGRKELYDNDAKLWVGWKKEF